MGLNKKGKEEEIKKVPKWKRQSEQFRNAMKNARGNDTGEVLVLTKGQGGGIGQVQQNNYDYDDYTHCDLCNRRYNEEAYNKHLPTCQRKNKESLLKGDNKVNNNNNNNTNTTNNFQKPNLNVKFNSKR